MRIYHPYESTTIDLSVSDESYRYRELQGEDYVQLEFSCAEPIELPLMSYIYVDYVPYKLLDKPKITKVHSRNYEYVARFESPQSMLKLYRFRNTVDRRLSFPLTAKPHEHLEMLIAQLEVRDSMWRIGECIDAPAKTINYDYLTCYEALELMASIFETEWEVVDGAISLHKVEYDMDNPLALSYGKDKGLLPGVERVNLGSEKPLLTICPQGGERNIDPSKYGSKTLRLPQLQSIKYDGRHFEDEPSYDDAKGVEYATDEDGTFVRRFIPTHNLAEGVLDCTEIYPHREGVVSVVIARDAAQNFYDIADKSIPDSLDYEDYRIVGEDMTIVFQTGMLAGKEFVVTHYAHNAVGNLPARRFEIEPREYDGMIMPGGDFKPAVGDKYAIFGTALPSAYIADNTTKSGAAWDMFRKCVKYLYDNEKPAYTFTGKLDPMFVKRHSLYDKLRVGAYISFSDVNFQPEAMLMRVASVKDYINDPANIEVSIKEKAFAPTSHVRQLERSSRESTTIDTKVRSLGKSTDTTVLRSQLNTLIGGDHEMSAREIAEDVVSASGGGGGGGTTNKEALDIYINEGKTSYNGSVAKWVQLYAPQDPASNHEQIVTGINNNVGWSDIKTINGISILGSGDIKTSENLTIVTNDSDTMMSYILEPDTIFVFTKVQTQGSAFVVRISDLEDENEHKWGVRFKVADNNTGSYSVTSDVPISWKDGRSFTTQNGAYYDVLLHYKDGVLYGEYSAYGDMTMPTSDSVYVTDFLYDDLYIDGIALGEDVECDMTSLLNAMRNNKVILVRTSDVAALAGGYVMNITMPTRNTISFHIVNHDGDIISGTMIDTTNNYIPASNLSIKTSDVYVMDIAINSLANDKDVTLNFSSLKRAIAKKKVILIPDPLTTNMMYTVSAGMGSETSIVLKVSNTHAYYWASVESNGDGTGTIRANNKMYNKYASELYVAGVVGDINTLLESIIAG